MRTRELRELCDDAEGCHTLTAWELSMLDSMRLRLEKLGSRESADLTERQSDALERISRKVYADS